MTTVITVIMAIGGVFIAIFAIPNLIKVVKTHNTAYINLPMYIIFTIACLCFAIYGLGMTIDRNLEGGLPELICNIFCVAIAIVTLVYKCKNMVRAKKAHMTELEYWKQHYENRTTVVEEGVK